MHVINKACVAACVSAATGILVVGLAIPVEAASGASNPTGTHTNQSACIGAQRATRNSDGGDRAQGGFGPANAAYIKSIQAGDTQYSNFGDFLAAWVSAYC